MPWGTVFKADTPCHPLPCPVCVCSCADLGSFGWTLGPAITLSLVKACDLLGPEFSHLL